MAASETKQGDKVELHADNTFTIVHWGATLKFKLRPEQSRVELVSVSEPEHLFSTTSQLQGISGPHFTTESLLDTLSLPNVPFYISKVIETDKDIESSLEHIADISKSESNLGKAKPRALFRLARQGGSPDVVQKICANSPGLDAHFISVPGKGKL